MKKYLLFIIVLSIGATACNKDNNDSSVFGKTPDERLTSELADYQSKLVASPYGWVATVLPDPQENNTIYPFWFRFTDSNRVTSRWKELPASVSSYRLKVLQRPELIFDTYSYLHQLSNPEPWTLPNTVAGKGLSSDFEFEIISASVDSFILKGKYHGTDMKLTKAAKGDSAKIVLPGYPLAGNYQSSSHRTFYRTTVAQGTILQVLKYVGAKDAVPLRFPGTVAIPYADYGLPWEYVITFDEATQTITKVEANKAMASQILKNSFKVLEKSYNHATRTIYLKTFYTNTAGADRIAVDTLIRN